MPKPIRSTSGGAVRQPTRAMQWAVDVPMAEPLDRLLLVVIARHVDHGTLRKVMKQSWLAEVSGIGATTVRLALKRLQQGGYIERREQFVGRSRQADEIVLLLPDSYEFGKRHTAHLPREMGGPSPVFYPTPPAPRAGQVTESDESESQQRYDQELIKAVIEAAGDALSWDCKATRPHEILVLLRNASFARFSYVIETIRRRARRKAPGEIASWRYFLAAIREGIEPESCAHAGPPRRFVGPAHIREQFAVFHLHGYIDQCWLDGDCLVAPSAFAAQRLQDGAPWIFNELGLHVRVEDPGTRAGVL